VGNLYRMLLDKLTKNPDARVEASLVEPTAEEAVKGLADLESCLPYWKESPALLVIKPTLGLIVTVLDSEHDRMGFAIRLAVQERLAAPPAFDLTEIKVACIWNQPYLSFHRSKISAPYSFYLHFGSEGVARARELTRSFHAENAGTPAQAQVAVTLLRGCFRPHAPTTPAE
jgi:hypothetical protein